MIRLIGADSGLTIAIIRDAEIILPNPMLMSFMTVSSSLDVLDLFADLFDLRFYIHHAPRDLQITRL